MASRVKSGGSTSRRGSNGSVSSPYDSNVTNGSGSSNHRKNLVNTNKGSKIVIQQNTSGSTEEPLSSSELNHKNKHGIRDLQNMDPSDVEKQATEYFDHAVDLERSGKLYEAIQFYRRAMSLIPDIEFRVHRRNVNENTDALRSSTDSPSEQPTEESLNLNNINLRNDNSDLFIRFKGLYSSAEPVCVPNFSQDPAHISCLPPEMIERVLQWVIGEDLDLRSLDTMSAVCKGFYLLARSPELWKKIGLKIWGSSITTFKPHNNWREMVLATPHPRFDGCYISCTTYYQSGESSFQDINYQPWQVVKYYRYVRFFSNGEVLMLTSSDEPQQIVSSLKFKDCKHPQVLKGHYCLHPNKVSMEFIRRSKERMSNRYAGRRHIGGTNDVMETLFYIEFEIDSVNKKQNWKLNWLSYLITSKFYDQGRQSTSDLEVLNSDNFPAFYFSRVKSYCSKSSNPLC